MTPYDRCGTRTIHNNNEFKQMLTEKGPSIVLEKLFT